MKPKAPHLIASMNLVLVLLALTSCGRGGYMAAPALQSESAMPVSNRPLPTDSLDRINGRVIDGSTGDPIIQAGVPSPQNPAVSPTAQTTSPYQTVRVRLFPIVDDKSTDTYAKSKSLDRLKLTNDSGLTVKSIAGPSFEATGTQLEFQFNYSKLFVDGKLFALSQDTQVTIAPKNSRVATFVRLDLNNVRLKSFRVELKQDNVLSFWGSFVVKRADTSVSGNSSNSKNMHWSLINYVQLEDYLHSVVPSEIGSSFHPEAIKTQAIAARTYALRRMVQSRCKIHESKCQDSGWDVDPTTQFQAYLGNVVEKDAISKLVSETKSQFLTFANQPILAMYHSSSGGKTVAARDYFCSRIAKFFTKCDAKYSSEYAYLSEVRDTFNGNRKRYGHGVGLPQWSAHAMAQSGSRATEILGLYYPGARLEEIH